jgi:hypothetical protein
MPPLIAAIGARRRFRKAGRAARQLQLRHGLWDPTVVPPADGLMSPAAAAAAAGAGGSAAAPAAIFYHASVPAARSAAAADPTLGDPDAEGGGPDEARGGVGGSGGAGGGALRRLSIAAGTPLLRGAAARVSVSGDDRLPQPAPQPGAVLLVEDNYALRGAPPLRGSSVDGDFDGPRGSGYGVGEWGGWF